jgi:hypothetical protein
MNVRRRNSFLGRESVEELKFENMLQTSYFVSEILLHDPSRRVRITRPLPCEEEGGRHLGFKVVGISNSAVTRERGDGGGGHWWRSRGYAAGARRQRGRRRHAERQISTGGAHHRG